MNSKYKIFLTRKIYPQAVEKLLSMADLEFWPEETPPPYEILIEQAGRVDGMITMLTDRLDAHFFDILSPRFKVVSQMAVGTDNIDLQTATRRGIPIGHTPGVLTESCADLTFALMLSAARRIVEGDREVHQGIWKAWGPNVLVGPEVFGATLGIVGMGRIGQAVARRAAGFNMRILYSHTKQLPDVEKQLGATFVPLDQLLAESDFISLHTYLSPKTYHLIDRQAFEKMKPGAILINAARGGVVDSEALLWALQEGKIRGAALDVFEPEPIPSGHPLLNMNNVVITPHIASAGITTRLKMADITVDNLIAGLKGVQLPHCANPKAQEAL